MIRAPLYVFPQYLSVGPGIIYQTSVIFTQASQFPTCDTGMGPWSCGLVLGLAVVQVWWACGYLITAGIITVWPNHYQHQHTLPALANLTQMETGVLSWRTGKSDATYFQFWTRTLSYHRHVSQCKSKEYSPAGEHHIFYCLLNSLKNENWPCSSIFSCE